MGSIISIAVIMSVGKLVKLHHDIKGRWITFLLALAKLKIRRRSIKPFYPFHDCFATDPHNVGLLPFQEEWDKEEPSKVSTVFASINE